ncbi:uncharacterized protein F54H12.2-like [Pleurodeles waltl]|uniref:uncharacterized protein F54H12.2-like n=1 Tax=Pleurodeles waltl TaxID=8319 RepID=UPI0037098261
MAVVHCASGECANSELDLFSLKPTQTSIKNSLFLEVSPLAALTLLAPIEFYVSGSTDMYLDLNNTLLHLVCKITKANITNIEDDAKVAPIAYLIATMFNEVDINPEDRLVTQSDNMYAYKAYIENKLLINGIDLKIKLTRNKDAFFLISGEAEQYKLVILSTSLFIKRVKVSLSVRLAHAEALQLSNSKYTIERVALKIFSISAGTRLTQQQNLFLGQLPKLIIIRFVDNTAFSGLYTTNPFNFKYYDINCATLVNEGNVIPAKPFIPSFGTSNFVREYLRLVSITGKHLRDSRVIVSREGYGAGYTFFAFDLTPDMEDGDHYSLIRNGNLKAEIRFTQALANNVNMAVFSVFDSVIQVNHARQLMFDYH